MKRYLAYKDSGIEWIGEIPEHWEVKKLKHFSKIVNGSTPKSGKSEYWGGEIVWATPNDLGKLNGNLITDSLKKITQPGLNSCGTTLTPKNSIILSTRAPIGHIGITDILTCTNQGCKTIVHDSSKCENKFLFYYLFSSKNTLQSLGQGSTFIELSSQNLKDFQNPFPPFPEQQTIANYLDRKTHLIDTLIEKKQKLIGLLKEQRAAIINQAVTKGLNPNVKLKDSGIEWLGEIPEHWDVKRLKYISNVQFSNVDKKSYEKEEDVFLCNYLDVYNNEFINGKIEFMKATALPREIEKFSIKYGDVLATKDSETPDDIANAALVTEDFNNVLCGYHLTHIRPDRRFLLGEYLFRLFCAKKFNDQFVVSANGITRYGLSTHSFNSSYISLSPLPEQKDIADYIDRKTNEIDTLIDKKNKSIEILKEYRTALISEVVTGKIDVMDFRKQEFRHS